MTEEDQIKLVRLEGFSFDIEANKFEEGIFAWSGNFVLKLQVNSEEKKVYCTLYYNNLDRRVAQAKKKKESKANKNPFVKNQ